MSLAVLEALIVAMFLVLGGLVLTWRHHRFPQSSAAVKAPAPPPQVDLGPGTLAKLDALTRQLERAIQDNERTGK